MVSNIRFQHNKFPLSPSNQEKFMARRGGRGERLGGGMLTLNPLMITKLFLVSLMLSNRRTSTMLFKSTAFIDRFLFTDYIFAVNAN